MTRMQVFCANLFYQRADITILFDLYKSLVENLIRNWNRLIMKETASLLGAVRVSDQGQNKDQGRTRTRTRAFLRYESFASIQTRLKRRGFGLEMIVFCFSVSWAASIHTCTAPGDTRMQCSAVPGPTARGRGRPGPGRPSRLSEKNNSDLNFEKKFLIFVTFQFIGSGL